MTKMKRIPCALGAMLLACASCGTLPDGELKRLVGRSEDELLREFGQPVGTITNTVGEFDLAGEEEPAPRVSALFPSDESTNGTVQIKHMAWRKRDTAIRVWLYPKGDKWLALYADVLNKPRKK